jgi:hypothetical protein
MIRIFRCLALIVFVVQAVLALARVHDKTPSHVVIDARTPASSPTALPFSVRVTSKTGHTLDANSRYLTLDNEPWFPVMGEFHYSRYPESEWEQEILKMKAGGINVVSTYVFWIHHEEIQGLYDWSDRRDLRHFVELCARHGMYVWVRIGPWDHGEVRNGGLPDWVVQTSKIRQEDPVFLGYVEQWFDQIGKQLKGLFWKDGGPIIGLQIENEYSARGEGKGEEYLQKLRVLALDAGLDAPFYTVTGWDNAVIPSHGFLPVFGGYADGFWWRSLTDLPPNPNYFFTKIRCEENVDDNLHSRRPDIDKMDAKYPFLTAEMGGGMEVAYHRRPALSPDDTAAMELVKLGSGVVMYGYYMFHGGTNPDGKKTSLQESQATGYPNDLPVKSYDFQAPLGEFGQMNPSYRVLKTFHLFLGDFGQMLAPMTSYLPEQRPAGEKDITTPRVAARLRHDQGFVFINNYERNHSLPQKENFQIKLKLASKTMEVPRRAVSIPGGAYSVWPVNLDLSGISLRYATAQLLCKINDPQTYVFFAWPGIAAEFAFKESAGVSIESATGEVTHQRGTAYVNHIEPGNQVSIRVRKADGIVNIIVLSREQALNVWRTSLAGKQRLISSSAQLYFDHDQLHVLADNGSPLNVGIFPALAHDPPGFIPKGYDGVFKIYSASDEKTSIEAQAHQLHDAGDDPPPKLGKEVAMAPDDSTFDVAATWSIDVPHDPSPDGSRIFLKITYVGDVARIYADGKLLTDNFYNGTPWVVGLGQFRKEELAHLELRILPLHAHAPIYLPASAMPVFSSSHEIARVKQVQVITEHEAVMKLGP